MNKYLVRSTPIQLADAAQFDGHGDTTEPIDGAHAGIRGTWWIASVLRWLPRGARLEELQNMAVTTVTPEVHVVTFVYRGEPMIVQLNRVSA